MKSISEYNYEIESRNVNVSTPEVIEFEITKTRIKNFPSSGIWIIISKPSSTIIPELREAISKNDFNQLESLLKLGSKSFVKVYENSIEYKKNLFNSIQEIPILADVTYGLKILAKCLFILPEQNYIFTFIPYYGDNLSMKDFRMSQYFKYGSVNLLNTLILIKKPILTDLEKSIFQKVPNEISRADLKEQSQDTNEENNINQRNKGKTIIEHFNNLAYIDSIENLGIHSSAIKLLVLRGTLVRRNLIQ